MFEVGTRRGVAIPLALIGLVEDGGSLSKRIVATHSLFLGEQMAARRWTRSSSSFMPV